MNSEKNHKWTMDFKLKRAQNKYKTKMKMNMGKHIQCMINSIYDTWLELCLYYVNEIKINKNEKLHLEKAKIEGTLIDRLYANYCKYKW